MGINLNPFQKHQLHRCCSNDELRPVWNYVYFINGIAYATNTQVLIAFSLDDLCIDSELIDCLEGHKMYYTDMEALNQQHRIYIMGKGKIAFNSEGTHLFQLPVLDQDDAERKYQPMLTVIEKAKSEIKSHAIAVPSIKVNLNVFERLSQAAANISMQSARLTFLKDANRIFVEFPDYKKSFALVMPMLDENA